MKPERSWHTGTEVETERLRGVVTGQGIPRSVWNAEALYHDTRAATRPYHELFNPTLTFSLFQVHLNIRSGIAQSV